MHGSRPRLAHVVPLAGLETERDEGAARPLPVLVLAGQEPGSPALGRHRGPLRPPLRLRGVEQVTHYLPEDRRVGVEQPVDHLGTISTSRLTGHGVTSDQNTCTSTWPLDGSGSP